MKKIKIKHKIGSKGWRTSQRRSIAQRIRYGAKIYDREGLIDFAERRANVGTTKGVIKRGTTRRKII